jgi:hypothetical protein
LQLSLSAGNSTWGAFVLARISEGNLILGTAKILAAGKKLKVYSGGEKGHRTDGICSGSQPSLYSFPSGEFS